MKQAFKIWLVAILYQTILFAFILDICSNEGSIAMLFFIPIELAGGVPGLFLFAAAMNALNTRRYSINGKWIAAVICASSSALATTLLTAMYFNMPFKEIGIFLCSATATSLLALLTFIPSVNKYFHENTIEETP